MLSVPTENEVNQNLPHARDVLIASALSLCRVNTLMFKVSSNKCTTYTYTQAYFKQLTFYSPFLILSTVVVSDPAALMELFSLDQDSLLDPEIFYRTMHKHDMVAQGFINRT